MTVEERLEKLEEKQDLINEKLDICMAMIIMGSPRIWTSFINGGMWGVEDDKTKAVQGVIDELRDAGRLR